MTNCNGLRCRVVWYCYCYCYCYGGIVVMAGQGCGQRLFRVHRPTAAAHADHQEERGAKVTAVRPSSVPAANDPNSGYLRIRLSPSIWPARLMTTNWARIAAVAALAGRSWCQVEVVDDTAGVRRAVVPTVKMR